MCRTSLNFNITMPWLMDFMIRLLYLGLRSSRSFPTWSVLTFFKSTHQTVISVWNCICNALSRVFVYYPFITINLDLASSPLVWRKSCNDICPDGNPIMSDKMEQSRPRKIPISTMNFSSCMREIWSTPCHPIGRENDLCWPRSLQWARHWNMMYIQLSSETNSSMLKISSDRQIRFEVIFLPTPKMRRPRGILNFERLTTFVLRFECYSNAPKMRGAQMRTAQTPPSTMKRRRQCWKNWAK